MLDQHPGQATRTCSCFRPQQRQLDSAPKDLTKWHVHTQPAREVVRPENQLALSEKELDEELPRTLTAGNPAAPANIVRFRRANNVAQARSWSQRLGQHTSSYTQHCLSSAQAMDAELTYCGNTDILMHLALS